MDFESLRSSLSSLIDDKGPWLLVIVVGLVFLAFLGRKRPQPDVQGAPRLGEYWMAEVPFRDGEGAKDRPCLVLSGPHSGAYRVLYMTSQDRSEHDAFIKVDTRDWQGTVGAKSSWLQIKGIGGDEPYIDVDFGKFRRRLGAWSKHEAKTVNAALRG